MGGSTSSAGEARRELYETMRADTSFEAKADRALELGETYLDVENGHLTRIDPDAEYWEAIATTDASDGRVPPGNVRDLRKTYCRRVVDREDTIALHDAPDQGWADDPAYEECGLRCYHGTPLIVDGEPFGTVCFVSEGAREPFDEEETTFAELVARLLEHELVHAEQKAELTHRADLIAVLSRVLRHNLRNDMTVVRGRLSMIEDRVDASAAVSETAFETIDDLLDLSDMARTLESIVTSDFERTRFELASLVERVKSSVERDHPDASITMADVGTTDVRAKPSIQTALGELVENAVEHGRNPVTVRTDVTSDEIAIHIRDAGPGLPEQERAVLRGETEMPLAHGTGLGLWVSYWIVDDHDGTTEVTVTEDGTRVTVTLPRETTGPEVTDEEALQRKLTRDRDLFEAVFAETDEPLLVANETGAVIDLNAAAAALFGRDRSPLLGRPVAAFSPDSFDFDAAWAEMLETGSKPGLFPLVQADGTERTVELDVEPNVVPNHHLVRLHEMTEREHRERELRRRTEQIAGTGGWEYDQTTETILWTDGTRRIHEVSDDYVPTVEDSLEFYHPEDRPRVRNAFEGALESGDAYRVEARLRTAEGGERWVETTGTPIETDGEVSGVRGAIRDVTDRKERKRRLDRLRDLVPAMPSAVGDTGH